MGKYTAAHALIFAYQLQFGKTPHNNTKKPKEYGNKSEKRIRGARQKPAHPTDTRCDARC